MTKLKFLLELEKKISALPQEDIEERLTFYSEMIEDRVEEGISEEDAVAQIGDVGKIAAQILADHKVETPAFVEETVTAEGAPVTESEQTKRRLKPWGITLLILGSPVWFSLLIAALAIVFSLSVGILTGGFSIWISLWAIFVSLTACAVALPVAAVYFMCVGYLHSGLAVIAAGFVCGGLAIFFFYGCKLATKGMVWLTKASVTALRNCFRRKEKAQ